MGEIYIDLITYFIAFAAGFLFGTIALAIGRMNRERDDYERGFTDGVKHIEKFKQSIIKLTKTMEDKKIED